MRKFSLVVAMLMSCGGTAPLVPVLEAEETSTTPEVVVPNEDAGTHTLTIPPVKVLDVEPPHDVDAGRNFPGNSENNPRCEAGRGKKLGLIKHGKCEPQ